MDDVVETAEIVRGFLEVRKLLSAAKIPQRAYQGKERCLAGAVLADEHGQRSQTGRLSFSKAAKVRQCDLVHG